MQRITLSTALLAAGLCGNPLPVVGAASGTHPNLVFILADDLGYGDLGSFGQQYIKTPNLDPLCADGMRLTNHYTGSTVCAPSRFTFVTGKHIGRAKTIGQGQQLAPNTQTIGTVLQSAGYRTACIGKWGLGNGTGLPNKQGFDHWFGFISQTRAHWYYNTISLWRSNSVALAV